MLFILQLASFFRLWPVYSVLWIFFLFAVVRLLKKAFFPIFIDCIFYLHQCAQFLFFSGLLHSFADLA